MNTKLPPCCYRVSVKALILDKTRTKFLVIQRQDGKWELVGGGLEWGEKPLDCLLREIKEETQLNVISSNSKPSYFITAIANSKDFYISNIIYEVALADLNFIPSDECIAVRFVSLEEVSGIDVTPTLAEFANVFDPKNH